MAGAPGLLSASISTPINSAQIGQVRMMMNTIANAHIFLLDDSMRVALVSIRSLAELSPEVIKKLEGNRYHWQSLRDQHFGTLLLMTQLVAWGVILEGPELAYELWNVVKRWREKPVREHAPALITFIGLIGWILVAVGVAGEFWVDSNVNSDDQNIQAINEQLLKDASSSASAAKSSAEAAATAAQNAQGASTKASTTSDKAETTAGGAITLARGARKEADSFERDIVSAKQQAAAAEQHLADALQKAADAQAELTQLKTPRSLTNASALATSLQAFKGTEYTFIGCFQDQESMDLLVQIDKVLTEAGWTRVKPQSQNSFADIQLNISKDFAVPLTTRSGVYVAVQSSETVDALKATPLPMLPAYLRAAMAIKGGLGVGINPPQTDLISPLQVDPGNSTSVFVIVGKKP